MSNEQPTGCHFYASSIGEWRTTTPERDLKQLLKAMDAGGLKYALWLVPAPHDTPYAIKGFAPQFPGAIWCGDFDAKRKG